MTALSATATILAGFRLVYQGPSLAIDAVYEYGFPICIFDIVLFLIS